LIWRVSVARFEFADARAERLPPREALSKLPACPRFFMLSHPAHAALDLAPKNWVKTRQRLIAEGRLKYIDLARATGSRLAFR
jgi:hypothetical protein